MRTIEQNRKLYWLFSRLQLNEDAVDALVLETTHGRTSSTAELEFIEALELIKYLDSLLKNSNRQPKPDSVGIDKKRKGLLRSIFAWYEAQGKVVNMEYVKATACRAAGVHDFNSITEAALTRLYAEFNRKQMAQRKIHREYHKYYDN